MSPGEHNHSLLRTAAVQTGVGKFVSVNGQTESILDFVGHTWSLSHLFLPEKCELFLDYGLYKKQTAGCSLLSHY